MAISSGTQESTTLKTTAARLFGEILTVHLLELCCMLFITEWPLWTIHLLILMLILIYGRLPRIEYYSICSVDIQLIIIF